MPPVVVCRRYFGHNLRIIKKLATGRAAGMSTEFTSPTRAGQIKSLLSLLSYLGTGEYRDRYLGVKIPPTNIQEYHLDEARKFANGLADQLTAGVSSSASEQTRGAKGESA